MGVEPSSEKKCGRGRETILSVILLLGTYTVLSILCFVFLFIFLRRANKAAVNTIRCPETGLIVAKEGIIYIIGLVTLLIPGILYRHFVTGWYMCPLCNRINFMKFNSKEELTEFLKHHPKDESK